MGVLASFLHQTNRKAGVSQHSACDPKVTVTLGSECQASHPGDDPHSPFLDVQESGLGSQNGLLGGNKT